MDHLAYPKLAERVEPGVVTPAGAWVATEKVHGAHLVVATDGQATRVGKRKAWLADDEPFFGWQFLRAELQAAALGLHRALGAPRTVRLYGELFGGGYPHPSVAALAGFSPVQTGVWYAPDVRFALFDVLVESSFKEPVLLSHTEVHALRAAHGLLVVPCLRRGSKEVVQALPIRYPTRIPTLLGYPILGDNMAEGIVYKPDARASLAQRIAIKRKIPEFEEARFDESAPWNPHVRLDMQSLQSIALRMVNRPRLAAARSKIGPVSASSCLQDEIVLDVLADSGVRLADCRCRADDAGGGVAAGPRRCRHPRPADVWMTMARASP